MVTNPARKKGQKAKHSEVFLLVQELTNQQRARRWYLLVKRVAFKQVLTLKVLYHPPKFPITHHFPFSCSSSTQLVDGITQVRKHGIISSQISVSFSSTIQEKSVQDFLVSFFVLAASRWPKKGWSRKVCSLIAPSPSLTSGQQYFPTGDNKIWPILTPHVVPFITTRKPFTLWKDDFQWEIEMVQFWGIVLKTADTIHCKTTTIIHKTLVQATKNVVTMLQY